MYGSVKNDDGRERRRELRLCFDAISHLRCGAACLLFGRRRGLNSQRLQVPNSIDQLGMHAAVTESSPVGMLGWVCHQILQSQTKGYGQEFQLPRDTDFQSKTIQNVYSLATAKPTVGTSR